MNINFHEYINIHGGQSFKRKIWHMACDNKKKFLYEPDTGCWKEKNITFSHI